MRIYWDSEGHGSAGWTVEVDGDRHAISGPEGHDHDVEINDLVHAVEDTLEIQILTEGPLPWIDLYRLAFDAIEYERNEGDHRREKEGS